MNDDLLARLRSKHCCDNGCNCDEAADRIAALNAANARADAAEAKLDAKPIGAVIARSGHETSKGCDALRRAGYVFLPKWWVTRDQFEVIERIAKGNSSEIWRIKHGDPD